MAITLRDIILPKRRANPKGTAYTGTFNPNQTANTLSLPSLRQHMEDIFTTRVANDARQLLTQLFRQDPDISATVNAFLSVANTTPRFYAYDENGQPDAAAQADLQAMVNNVFMRQDYSTGFQLTDSLKAHCEKFRYALLLTGGLAGEWLFDKSLLLSGVRHVNLNEIEWLERSPGEYKPVQKPAQAGGVEINLDIVTFMVKYFRQSPFEAYAQSPFISCINTIASRQQVINDLYRIMQRVGYPRITIKVAEEIIRNSMPPALKAKPDEAQAWVNARVAEISNTVANLEPEQALVHTDAIEPEILNEGGPGKSMDVESIIKVLNAQNQAALKTMASIIGRGESGVNTATVEARIFSISAQELNEPIADFLSDGLTLAMRMTGYAGSVVCEFDPVELRPSTELEPQLALRQNRMLENLSLGLITDDEYHMEMFNRPAPAGSPQLSGTNFRDKAKATVADGVSPNSDPLGRSVSPEGGEAARSNSVSSGAKK